MDIWIVVTEDRHADIEVTPFMGEADAIEFAESEVEANALDPQDITAEDREVPDGYAWFCQYSVEGDCVWVVRRELRETGTS